MRPYPKIETLYYRNNSGKLTNQLRNPLYEDIIWHWTEKVDGTNIRLNFHYEHNGEEQALNYSVKGRTDKAQLPPELAEMLHKLAINKMDEAGRIMDEHELGSLTLYGEGYGPKIQKGGGNYRDDVGFILFDVMANDRWLSLKEVAETARRLNVTKVPSIGAWPIEAVMKLVERGFESTVAAKHGKSCMAEGIVGKTREPLYDRRGRRLVVKLKTEDFA